MKLVKASYKDCKHFNRWENDPQVIRFLSISNGKTMEESVRELIQREQNPTVLDFVVTYQGEKIGRAYLSRLDRISSSVDITRIYIGEPSKRGIGLGRKMMEELLVYCFEQLKLHRVTLDFYDGNKAQELYRSLGFVDEGIARDAGYKDGKYHNFNLMSLLKPEYEARKSLS